MFHVDRHGTSSVDTLSDLEESRVKSILFDSLEQFIAGKEDVQSVFSKLTESDTPPAVCGHVFKPGGMIHDICNQFSLLVILVYDYLFCRDLLQLPWLRTGRHLCALRSMLHQERAQAAQVQYHDYQATHLMKWYNLHTFCHHAIKVSDVNKWRWRLLWLWRCRGLAILPLLRVAHTLLFRGEDCWRGKELLMR